MVESSFAGSGEAVLLPSPPGAPEEVHLFSEDEIIAVQTALAAKRALLVRGEPGTGKTQLARATAVRLRRMFVSAVVDSRTESRDLMWHLDAVRRLADAQVYGALISRSALVDGSLSEASPEEAAAVILRDKLQLQNYIEPRALWWGLAWNDAATQAARAGTAPPVCLHECSPENGSVVLIDEIDKGEADVPNGLLAALGSGSFAVPGRTQPVQPTQGVPAPLVVITANDERALPDAFVRRCVTLTLRLPNDDKELISQLVARGLAHFPPPTKGARRAREKLLQRAAEQLVKDRRTTKEMGWRPLPGQAEYMDLIRAVLDLAKNDAAVQQGMLDRIAPFLLRKHPPPPDTQTVDNTPS